MILQSLFEYYQRKATLGTGDAAPQGFQWKPLPYLIVITREGTFVRIEDTGQGTGKENRAKRFLVPIAPIRSGKAIRPGLLWDQLEYAIGANPRNRADIVKRFNSFRERIQRDLAHSKHPSLQALCKFLDSCPSGQIATTLPGIEWQRLQDANPFVTFRIEGELPITDVLFDSIPRPAIEAADSAGQFCPVSGGEGKVPTTHSKISGVWGAQSAGATLVAFNLSSAESYGKTQNLNAPMSATAADGYTKALNMLLGRDSKNRVQVGDASTVFWSERESAFEKSFFSFWSVEKDDPDCGVEAVETLLRSVHTGSAISDSNSKFFVLGLSPNAARISVRFWQTGTIGEFSNKLAQHFRDLQLVQPKNVKARNALFFLLSEIALENKIENIPPNLAGNVMRAVLTGGPYPVTLLQQTIRRIRANRQLSPSQVALLKAYLVRQRRFQETPIDQEIQVSLDTTNRNAGYLLGRLFAALEKIQEDAQRGINSTIRDRFYGAASTSPISVFPQLLKLKNHHLNKLANASFRISHEKRLAEIFDGLPPSMPAHLTMDDQARFAVGYYHQRQALFNKSERSAS